MPMKKLAPKKKPTLTPTEEKTESKAERKRELIKGEEPGHLVKALKKG